MTARQQFIAFHYERLVNTNANSKTVEIKVTYRYHNKSLKRVIAIERTNRDNDRYYIDKAKALINKQIASGDLLTYSKQQIDEHKHKVIKYSILGGAISLLALIIILLSTGVFGSLETIVRVLKTSWTQMGVEEPAVFGWFHITCICVMLATTVTLLIFFHKANDKNYRRIIFAFWALIFVFEIFKEVLITYQFDDNGHLIVYYDWTQFPFQICSTPYYTLPFIVFLKEGRARKAVENYCAIFLFIGGFANYCFPEMVFFDSIFLTVQSMVHHGTMITVAIYLAVHNKENLCLRHWLSGFAIFVGLAIIAIILNEVMWQCVPVIHSGDKVFNMFFISTHFECNLPIFMLIFNNPAIPKWVSIFIFLIGCAVLSYLVMMIYSLIITHTVKPCLTIKKETIKKLSKK